MNLSRTNVYRLLICVAAAIYCLIVFLSMAEFTKNFWILFSFTIAVFVAAFVSTFLKGDGRTSLANRIYFAGIPVFYLVVQLLLHFLLLFPSLSFIVVLLIEIFFTLAVLAFTLVRMMGTSVIDDNLARQRKQVRYLAKLEICLAECEAQADDASVKTELHSLVEKVRYSDYNSIEEVHGIEEEMVGLALSISEYEPAEQLQVIKRINVLLSKRNNMILMLK